MLRWVQGGLEIPCVVKAEMIGTQKNKLLTQYLEIVLENYNEVPSEQEVIMGSFTNTIESPDEDLEELTSVVASGSRENERKIKKTDK